MIKKKKIIFFNTKLFLRVFERDSFTRVAKRKRKRKRGKEKEEKRKQKRKRKRIITNLRNTSVFEV